MNTGNERTGTGKAAERFSIKILQGEFVSRSRDRKFWASRGGGFCSGFSGKLGRCFIEAGKKIMRRFSRRI